MKIKRTGSAAWQGAGRTGRGSVSTQSGALAGYPYGFSSRFEGQPGTNPEELIAAAHASCFTMALSMVLGQAGLAPTRLDVRADVSLEQLEDGFSISAVQLTLRAVVPGADTAAFARLAGEAKAICPVSKLLRADISLDAELA